MSGRRSQRKGYTEENAIVKEHEKRGFLAKRLGSGGFVKKQDVETDVDIQIYPSGEEVGRKFDMQVKARKDGSGFKTLYNWISNNEVLAIRMNQKRPLYVVTEETWFELLKGVK